MSYFDRLFSPDAPASQHPTARAWLSQGSATSGAVITIQRKRDGLMFGPIKLRFVASPTPGAFSDSYEWDDELNEHLIQAQVKSESPANESLRFALTLRYRFQAAESAFGDDYFSAVLVEYLDNNGFGSFPEVSEMRRYISSHKPRRGREHPDCVAAVEGVLAKSARDLLRLGYSRSESEHILVTAIAQYLDERFSITNAKMLGLM